MLGMLRMLRVMTQIRFVGPNSWLFISHWRVKLLRFSWFIIAICICIIRILRSIATSHWSQSDWALSYFKLINMPITPTTLWSEWKFWCIRSQFAWNKVSGKTVGKVIDFRELLWLLLGRKVIDWRLISWWSSWRLFRT